MKTRALAFLVGLSVLPGCFLTQKDPKPAAVSTKTPVAGTVAVEELTVGNSGSIGSVYAVFGKRATPAKRLYVDDVEAIRLNRAVALSSFSPSDRAGSRATSCEKLASKKRDASMDGRAEAARLSVGRLLFGPPFQEKYSAIEPNDKLQYQARLDTPLPAGIYVSAAEGTAETHGFGETTISVPESLREARIASGYLGDPGTFVRRADGVALSWRAPVIPNDRNVLQFTMLAQKDGKTSALVCAGFEQDFATTGTDSLTWNLGPNWFDHFPTDVDAELYFVRAHLFGAKNENAEVRLQGIRTHYAKAPLVP